MAQRLRPRTVRVMPEWTVRHPLWSDDPNLIGPLEADQLGLSPAVSDALAAWNRVWEEHASQHIAGRPVPTRVEAEWNAEGHRLAEQVQRELGGDVHVYLHDPSAP